MNRLRALSITAALFAVHACFMPHIVQWNIGERIRERVETRVGADVTQRFLCGETRQLLAPEVCYRARTPLITLIGENDADAQHITPTGHLRAVSLPRIKGPRMHLPPHARTTVGERWAGNPPAQRLEAPALGYSPGADSTRWLGTAERQRGEDYPLAATLAAPFDYLIDPILSILCAPVVTGGALFLIACAIWSNLSAVL